MTEKGYKRLALMYNHWGKLLPTYKERTPQYYKDRADKEGYTSFQMWSFMEQFGEVTTIGMDGYFETHILIDSKDLTEHPHS